jgi:arabinofuranosyltransferase
MKKNFPWLILLIVLLALLARLIPGPRIIDDSFITFRYARNILMGLGFTYNPGEFIQGTTTPLYTLIMTGLGLLFGGAAAPFATIAWILNALLDSATCYLLVQLGKKLQFPLAGYATALVWAVAPYSVTFSIGGLETSLFVFLLTATIYAYLQERYALSALAAGLSILTRPDAILLAIPVVADRLYLALRKHKAISLTEWLALLLIPAAWFAFATLTFGSPIPHSVTAKLAVYQLGEGSALIRFLQHYATPFLDQHLWGIPAIQIGIVVYPFLAFIGLREAIRKNVRIWPLALYPWVYLLVFSLPNPLIFRWYLTPPLPAYFLFIFIGLISVASLLQKAIQQPTVMRIIQWILLAALFAYPLGSNLSAWQIHPDHGSDRPAPEMAFIKLELLYHQAAEMIMPHLQPGDKLAAGDVGVLGYETGSNILDTVGLNSAESLAYYPIPSDQYVINYAIPTALILTEKPDAIIILEVYARNTFLKDPTFNAQYTLLDTIPTDMYGSRGMLLYLRNRN